MPDGLGARGTLHAKLRCAADPHGPVVGGLGLELLTTSTRFPSTITETGTVQVLHRGTLAVQGVQRENRDAAPIAVTGGTGRYTAAAGTLTAADDGTITIVLAAG